jgi:hypothetical protein
MMTNQPTRPSGIDGGTDQRVILAREYLAGVSQQHVDQLPPSVLVRECAELRRQFGQVLTAVADQPTALTEAQQGTILAALSDAVSYRTVGAHARCEPCMAHPAGCRDRHADDLDQADAYRQLAREIGGHQ